MKGASRSMLLNIQSSFLLIASSFYQPKSFWLIYPSPIYNHLSFNFSNPYAQCSIFSFICCRNIIGVLSCILQDFQKSKNIPVSSFTPTYLYLFVYKYIERHLYNHGNCFSLSEAICISSYTSNSFLFSISPTTLCICCSLFACMSQSLTCSNSSQ